MPGHKFSKADREKAVATRLKNAADRKLKAQQAVVATATTQLSVDLAKPGTDRTVEVPKRFVEGTTIPFAEFDWWDSPLPVVVDRLNKMKGEYDRAAQVVLQRQSQEPPAPLVCWVWENRKNPGISKAAVGQCKRTIANQSKAAFINNGHKDTPNDPQEKVRTIVCCSMQCFVNYQQLRPIGGLSRH